MGTEFYEFNCFGGALRTGSFVEYGQGNVRPIFFLNGNRKSLA